MSDDGKFYTSRHEPIVALAAARYAETGRHRVVVLINDAEEHAPGLSSHFEIWPEGSPVWSTLRGALR